MFFQFSSVQSLSRVQFLQPPWTTAHQAPLSMGFPSPEYWNELPFPSPDPGIKPASPALAGRFFTTQPLGKPNDRCYCHIKCSSIITHKIIFNKSNPFDDFKDSLSSFLLAFQLLLNLNVLVLSFFSILLCSIL